MMKSMMSVALLGFVALAGCKGGESEDAEYRTVFAGQCEQQVRSRPEVPQALDVRGACACGVDAAFKNRSGVMAFAQTPDGQQLFARSLATCLQERMAALAVSTPGAATPAAVAPASPAATDAAAREVAADTADEAEEGDAEAPAQE